MSQGLRRDHRAPWCGTRRATRQCCSAVVRQTVRTWATPGNGTARRGRRSRSSAQRLEPIMRWPTMKHAAWWCCSAEAMAPASMATPGPTTAACGPSFRSQALALAGSTEWRTTRNARTWFSMGASRACRYSTAPGSGMAARGNSARSRRNHQHDITSPWRTTHCDRR